MVARLTPLAAALALLGAASSVAAGGAEQRHATIYSIRPDGSGRQLLLRLDAPAYYVVRSPGGKRIAFVTSEGLYVADVSGEHAEWINAPSGNPTFSADGKKLVVTSFIGCGWRCYRAMLHVVNTDGTGLHMLAEHGENASWAPDGTRLVYSDGVAIHVVSASGTEDKRIATGLMPKWAPRGERIAYLGYKSRYSVPCFVDADGSDRRCLHGFSAVNGIVWSRDGERLAFMQATPPRLGVVRADGGGLRRFNRMRLRARPLAWSPDGRRLAYSKGFIDKEIYVRPIFGRGGERRVTNEMDQSYFGDVRWRAGRISYVVFE